MPVTIDTYSGPGNQGQAGVMRLWNVGFVFNATLNTGSWQTIGSGATFLLAGYNAAGDTTAANSTGIGTIDMVWGSGGPSPQAMTRIGTPFYNSADNTSLQLFGLVNPNSGLGGMGVVNSNNTNLSNGNGGGFSISFKGTDPAGSVASIVEGFGTASGTGTTLAIPTAISIPSGDMAVSWFQADGGPITSWPSDGGTAGDFEFNSIYFETYPGAGSVITAGGVQSSAHWTGVIVGLKALSGGGGGTVGGPVGSTNLGGWT